MIKLQDFARDCGVTDRAIQKHLKTYATELEGLFERKGPNGTWLSDEACKILKSKMKQQPLVVFDEDPRIGEMEKKIRKLEDRLERKELYIEVLEEGSRQKQERLNLLEGNQLLLEEQNAQIEDLKAQNAVLSVEKGDAIQKASDAEKKAQEANMKASALENMSVIDFIKYKLKKGKKNNGAENQKTN